MSGATRYGWATLDLQGEQLLARWAAGVHLWDVMCGRGELADMLLDGPTPPKSVESVDKESTPKPHPRRVHTYTWMDAWQPQVHAGAVLLSWPVNWDVAGAVERIRQVGRILYIGNNRTAACGGRRLWMHLAARPVVAAHRGPYDNTIIVFGAAGVDTPDKTASGAALGEIRGACDQWGLEPPAR